VIVGGGEMCNYLTSGCWKCGWTREDMLDDRRRMCFENILKVGNAETRVVFVYFSGGVDGKGKICELEHSWPFFKFPALFLSICISHLRYLGHLHIFGFCPWFFLFSRTALFCFCLGLFCQWWLQAHRLYYGDVWREGRRFLPSR